MRPVTWCGLALMLAGGLGRAEEAFEATVPTGASDPKAWYTAECEVALDPAQRGPDGQPSIRWHVSVDHFTGEPNYPIGWPRCGLAFKPAADWRGYDYLTFQMRADTSREQLPKTAAGFAVSGAVRGEELPAELPLVKGQWITVRVPLEALPNPTGVSRLQWHIAEANYQHQDKVTFWIAGLKLLRYTRPTALSWASLERVVTSTAGYVIADLRLGGLPPGQTMPATVLLRVGNQTTATAKVTVRRGRQRLLVPVGRLATGTAALVLQLRDGEDAATAPLEVVSGPFAD